MNKENNLSWGGLAVVGSLALLVGAFAVSTMRSAETRTATRCRQVLPDENVQECVRIMAPRMKACMEYPEGSDQDLDCQGRRIGYLWGRP